MAYVNLDKMSVNDIKVYVAELEAKIKVYESVISNSNFRGILGRPSYSEDSEKPKYSPRPYKGNKKKMYTNEVVDLTDTKPTEE